MRAVFLDESGRGNDFYFFGGLLVDDVSIRRIESGLDGVARLLAAHVPGFSDRSEFHGTDMFHGKAQWDRVPVAWRAKASELVAKVIARSGAQFIFRGIDLNLLRARYAKPFPAHLLTLAQLLEELDRRIGVTPGDVAIVLADDHHSASSSRRNLADFKIGAVPGYTQGQIVNLADTLYFGPSQASRMLQAADVATYFTNRHLTIIERDPRAARSVGRIWANIEKSTVHSYVWRP